MTRISDESHRGDAFESVDFTGATFRDCGFSSVKAVDCNLVGLHLSGVITGLVVNDVDICGYVEAELDRRHPERVQVRAMQTPDELRATWVTIEQGWADAVERARRLPEAARQERVDDEWSFVETLRHLVYAADAWAARTILDRAQPYHRLGLVHTGYDPVVARELGVDLDATPSFDEVLAVRAERMAMVGGIVAGVTDAELARPASDRRPPATRSRPGRSVRACGSS